MSTTNNEKDYHKLAVQSILHEADERAKGSKPVERRQQANTHFLRNVLRNATMHNSRVDEQIEKSKQKAKDKIPKPSCSYEPNTVVSEEELESLRMTNTEPFILWREKKKHYTDSDTSSDGGHNSKMRRAFTYSKVLQGPFVKDEDGGDSVYRNKFVEVTLPMNNNRNRVKGSLETLKIVERSNTFNYTSPDSPVVSSDMSPQPKKSKTKRLVKRRLNN